MTEYLLELIKAKATIIVSVILSYQIFPIKSTFVGIEIVKDSEFVWADLFIIVNIVLVEDCDYVKIVIILTDWAFFIAINDLAEDALEVFKAKKVIVVSVVFDEHLFHC